MFRKKSKPRNEQTLQWSCTMIRIQPEMLKRQQEGCEATKGGLCATKKWYMEEEWRHCLNLHELVTGCHCYHKMSIQLDLQPEYHERTCAALTAACSDPEQRRLSKQCQTLPGMKRRVLSVHFFASSSRATWHSYMISRYVSSIVFPWRCKV